jgi:hypothetical protein
MAMAAARTKCDTFVMVNMASMIDRVRTGVRAMYGSVDYIYWTF